MGLLGACAPRAAAATPQAAKQASGAARAGGEANRNIARCVMLEGGRLQGGRLAKRAAAAVVLSSTRS